MKRKIIIIFSVLVFLAILIYFAVILIGKNTEKKNNTQDINKPAEISTSTEGLVSASSTSATSSPEENIATSSQPIVGVEAVNEKFLEYLPKTSSEQLNSFSGIAANGNMSGCEKLSAAEVDNCKYYFSLYVNNHLACGDIETNALKLKCYKQLILENLTDKISRCNQENVPDSKVNCLDGVFWGIENLDECSFFADKSVNQLCLDSLNLRSASAKNNNCSKIKDTILKTFCDQYVTPGDFDKDGLSDAEELKIGTNPYAADTDGDGYSDKDEVDKGYNPCGEGLMPTPAKLLEACAALKK